MINVTVREDMIATAFGLTTLIMAVGGVLGPIGLGYLADELGSYRYPFYVLAGTYHSPHLVCAVVRVRWCVTELSCFSIDQGWLGLAWFCVW
jgi:nitrate/nitrite transporter NarK